MTPQAAIAKVVGGADLTGDEIAAVFGAIMDGEVTPAQIGGLLVALRMKGETATELAGAARAMRERATPLEAPADALDTCGTGGDGSGTVNVSTLAAIIAAGAGATVAKHGNRALSSRAGSADVLEVLGVKIDCAPLHVARCIRDAGIGFAFAPGFHAATRHVAAPRKELGTRTLFNLLGPMTNPACVRYQVIGVFDAKWCAPMAEALGQLGAGRAFVVHGAGGLDEIAVSGDTVCAEWTGTRVETRVIDPDTFGLAACDPAGLAGGDAAFNAGVLRAVLAADGIDPSGPRRAVAIAAAMTAGLALVASGRASDPRDGASQAFEALRSGAAADVLARWAAASQEQP